MLLFYRAPVFCLFALDVVSEGLGGHPAYALVEVVSTPECLAVE
jgi:hypothetical protein